MDPQMDKERRVAIFLPDLIGAGAQRVMLNLAIGMDRRGVAVEIVLAKAHGSYLVDVPKSIRVVDLAAPRLLACLPALARYLRQESPPVILSGLSNANVVALWARRLARVPTRVVITEHNTLSVDLQNPRNWRAKQVPRLIKRFYGWADAIVAVSRGVADDLASTTALPRDHIHPIYNPVILPELAEKARQPVDHPWLQAGESPVVLGVGRLTAQKNFSLLIRAFAKARQKRQLRLLILGEGEERPLLEDLIHRLGLQEDVSLPGFVANPYAYMAHSALFVLSSSWEGLPTVLIEAIYCSRGESRVISTDCPSGPSEILADGKYGRLVPVDDVDALARAIESASDGAKSSISSNADFDVHSAAWQPFELETVVDQYLDVLFPVTD